MVPVSHYTSDSSTWKNGASVGEVKVVKNRKGETCTSNENRKQTTRIWYMRTYVPVQDQLRTYVYPLCTYVNPSTECVTYVRTPQYRTSEYISYRISTFTENTTSWAYLSFTKNDTSRTRTALRFRFEWCPVFGVYTWRWRDTVVGITGMAMGRFFLCL